MRHAIEILVLATLAVWMSGPASGAPLDDMRWRYRVVVLFGSGPEVERQRNWLLEQPRELDERRILILQVDRGVRILHGATTATLPSAASLRASLDVEETDAYEAVLIGLDGGVKWRSPIAVRSETLFSVIDAMPMRRADARRS